MAKGYWLMDGRANHDVDAAYVLECCDDLEEAEANVNAYGADTCIVDVETQEVVYSLMRKDDKNPGDKKNLEIERTCPECGKALVERKGSTAFLGCSGFPRCRYTRQLTNTITFGRRNKVRVVKIWK